MITPTIVFIACAFLMWRLGIRRVREYQQEIAEIREQAAHYTDNGC